MNMYNRNPHCYNAIQRNPHCYNAIQQNPYGNVDPKNKRQRNPYVSGAMFLLSATAMAVSYSRNKSILRSFGAGFVSVPYLIYVAIDTHKKK